MDSVIVRRIFCLYRKQLSKCEQSWRQFSTLYRHSQRPTNGMFQRHLSDKADKTSKSSEAPFISPVNKPHNPYTNLLRHAKQKKTGSKGPNIYVIGATAVGFVVLYYYVRHQMKQQQVALLQNTIMREENVLIGGDWELINQDGKKVTNKDYEGDWCLIYFGFTHCPDICPDEIEKIVEVMDILGKNPSLPKLKALFVTVDPDRDSPEALKTYLEEFSDRIVGLTGSYDELKKIWNAFKVYHSMGPKDEDGDYIVDHSIITYLMNPEGKYEGHYARSKTNIEVANAVENKMLIWQPNS